MKAKQTSKTSLISLGGLMGVTLLSGAVLKSTVVKADVDDEITITVSQSCTMTGSVTDAHTETIANGQYDSTIGETAVNVTCNDNAGFAVYAIGYTGNTLGNNKLTSSALGTTHDIVTGTGLSGNSQWAMKLATVTDPVPTYPIIIAGSSADGNKAQGDPDFSSFQQVPDDYTKVAYRATGTDVGTGSTGANFTTTYQAYISPTQAAGTYTGKVKYVLVHPNTAPAPQKPQGHCADANTCMQQQTSASLAQKLPNTGSTTTLYDSRDGKAYTVAKLADGKYWMTTNLDLAGGKALSADDTDLTSAYISSFTTSNNLTKTGDTIVLPASATKNDANNNLTDNTQFSQDNYSYVFNSGNTTNCGASGQDTPCYSYYSWDAVTLGSGRSLNADNTDAEQSICPKGWRLPTSGADSNDGWKRGDFYTLATAYGVNLESVYYDSSPATGLSFYDNAGPSSTADFLLSGNYYSDAFGGGGTYGDYWSSTSYSDTGGARSLYFDTGSFNSAGYYYRRNGMSVRCLFGTGE